MAKKSAEWSTGWETLALFILHAYPTLYCRSRALQPGTPAAAIFDLFREHLVRSLQAMPMWKRAFVIAVWPPMVVCWAFGLTLANGMFASRRFHRRVVSQFVDQMQLAFGHGVPPSCYYRFELHDPDNRSRAHEYIHRAYLKMSGTLYKSLYAADFARKQRAKTLNDKLGFHTVCQEHHLPTARLIVVASDGAFSWTDKEEALLPKIDLFIKPQWGNGGVGTERWDFRGDRYYCGEDRSLSATELASHVEARSRSETFLVYECLANHHEILDLTAGALSTLRTYTFWNEHGRVEHIFTMLRMSQSPKRHVDNVCRGGLAAMMDPTTGVLGKATGGGVLARTGWLDRHPFTNALIVGRQIPMWREALDLSKAAHAQIEAPIVVGWDIAITEQGPVIIEGNKAPDIEIEQRLSGPWGNQRFGELLVYHAAANRSTVESRAA